MNNHIVIGSNYGDEGKGRTVDFLVRKEIDNNPIVIRFSGSNNAGHTVSDNGTRNVFSLLGSGSFNNVPTFLSKHVMVDVNVLCNEIDKFKLTCPSYDSIVYIDPRCKIILPYDVALNRLKEVERSQTSIKHGSTGNGHNEAITRSEMSPICVGNILLPSTFTTIVDVHHQFNSAYKKYDQYFDLLDVDTKGLITMLLEPRAYREIEQMLRCIMNNKNVVIGVPDLSQYSCIFEGSQGLALDEYIGKFPHVTRGRTSSFHVIDICRDHNIEIDTVWYVSRPYLSRHGNDPYFYDNSEKVLTEVDIVDKTNIHNDWQGSLKFDFLDISKMAARINLDYDVLRLHFNLDRNIVFSCVDQIKNSMTYIRSDTTGSPRVYSTDDFIKSMNLLFINVLGYDDLISFDSPENS